MDIDHKSKRRKATDYQRVYGDIAPITWERESTS
jgi:hypothetical protein